MDRAALAAFWESFRQACGVDAGDYDTFAFGDSAEMADELARLVRTGPSGPQPGCCWTTSATRSRSRGRARSRWCWTGAARPSA